jgi:DNA polymerase III epsilon subunit-like protein
MSHSEPKQRVYLDTETTGLGDDAQIIEIAIVCERQVPLSDGKNSMTGITYDVILSEKIRPTVSIDKAAQRIHGISLESLKDAPTWPHIAAQVAAAVDGKKVGIFNSDFDIRMLRQTATAFGDEAKWIDEIDTFCVMCDAAEAYGSTNQYGTISLANAVLSAGIEWQGEPHSAAGDALTTMALSEFMFDRDAIE